MDLPGGYGLSYKAPPPIGPPPPAAPKVVASQVGLGKAPGVVGPTGEEARPEEEPTVDGPPPGMAARMRTDRMPGPAGFDPSFGKSGAEIGAEVTRGALAGVGGAVGDALSIDLLHVPTGLIRIVGDAWASGDPVGGLSAIFWEPGRAQVDQVVASAVEGDFEGAAEAGVKAITVGVATGVVIGEIGGAGVEAAKDAAPQQVRNGHLAGEDHPTTGVPFDTKGFPDLRAAGLVQKEVQIEYTGSRTGDFASANRAAGLASTPNGMTWHHHQDGKTMQLVPINAHGKTGHTGGFSLKRRIK